MTTPGDPTQGRPAGGEDAARAMALAIEELDRIDGTLQPDFVQVQDGFYSRRIVLDGPLTVGRTTEDPAIPDRAVVEFHYEPCHIPRYRTKLLWRRVQHFGGGADAP